MNHFYVYVLFRPWDGSPAYVGKGHGDRIDYHEKKGDQHYNKRLARLIKKAGGSVPKVKVREDLSEEQAFELEFLLIRIIGRADLGRGPLVNLTDGGEGMRGAVYTEATLELMRNSAKARWAKESERDRVRQYHAAMTPEQKQARAAMISKIVLTRVTPESRAKISAALSGRVHDEARRRLTSESVKKAHRDNPEMRKKIGAENKGRQPMLGKKHSEETKAQMSRAHTGRGHTPETRERMKVAQKLSWVKRKEANA